MESKTVLSFNKHMISRNPRFMVLADDHYREWQLRIRNDKTTDRGYYMCQISSDPMVSDQGYLEVTESPIILNEGTSRDLTIDEFQKATLSCKVSGHPMPTIEWIREDKNEIVNGRKRIRKLVYLKLIVTISHFGHLLVTFWSPFGHLLVTIWSPFGHLLGHFSV